MSLWNRRKYTVNRRQSSPNPGTDLVTHSGTNSPEPTRRNSSVRSFLTRSANRLSRSLIDLTEHPPPPPLPPRRIPKPQNDSPQVTRDSQRSENLNPGNHFQLPPTSVLPVLERNASARSSRFMNPFVLIQFDDTRSNSTDLLNRLGHESSTGFLTHHNYPGNSRRHFDQRHHSLVLPRNFIPNWIQQKEDLPPSYEDAVKMNQPVPASVVQSTNTQINIEQESTPKRFVKETSV